MKTIFIFVCWLCLTFYIFSGPKLLKLEVGDCFSNIKEESWELEESKLIIDVGKTKYRAAFWFDRDKKYITNPKYTISYNKSSINEDQYKKVECFKEGINDE